jgi:Fic family protein
MILGEVRSKIEHVSGSLLKPEIAAELLQVFLAKGALATTAIEGNTLTEEDARLLLEGELRLPPSQEYLAREIRNIVDAYNDIKDELIAGVSRPVSPSLLANYNRAILRDLELDDHVVPGEISEHSVVVGRYLAAPREDCKYLLQRLCDWLNGPTFVPPSPDWRLPYAVLKAIAAHLYIAWIHPFGDGNGRTARLLELRILIEAGVPTPSAHLLSNHYNQTRSEYYRQLDLSSRSGEGIVPFFGYALRGFVDGLREQLALIREQQFKDRWEQFVYQSFGGTKSEAEMRQRQLVLELSKAHGPVEKKAVRLMSPELVDMYQGRTGKTLTRDINRLIERGLIHRTPGGYVPAREQLEAFRPVMADPTELF